MTSRRRLVPSPSVLISKFNRLQNFASFKFRQRIRGVQIADTPMFGDPASREYFADRLLRSRFYLEYGSGGSTVLAARLQKRFISVESDGYYLRAVRKKIAQETRPSNGLLLHAYIGIT